MQEGARYVLELEQNLPCGKGHVIIMKVFKENLEGFHCCWMRQYKEWEVVLWLGKGLADRDEMRRCEAPGAGQ